MHLEKLSETILHHVGRSGTRVSVAGIRYGSVAYIGFGDAVTKLNKTRPATTCYTVEIEFGADRWELRENNNLIMDSNFVNADVARTMIGSLLTGRKVQGIETDERESRLSFEGNLTFISYISSEPASGFLYSFQVENGPSWETVDGVAKSVSE